MVDRIYELKFYYTISSICSIQVRGCGPLFIPWLVLPHLSEITHLGLLVKFSNHIIVMNQAPMIERFLTVRNTKFGCKKCYQRLSSKKTIKSTLDVDLQGSCSKVGFFLTLLLYSKVIWTVGHILIFKAIYRRMPLYIKPFVCRAQV